MTFRIAPYAFAAASTLFSLSSFAATGSPRHAGETVIETGVAAANDGTTMP